MEAWTEVVGGEVQEGHHVFWVPVEGTAPNRGEERKSLVLCLSFWCVRDTQMEMLAGWTS